MDQINKLKKQRYEAEMKILTLEEKLKRSKLIKNEEKELEFLKKRVTDLNKKIESLT